MGEIDQELERLIVRRLDGAGDEEESLRLNRELIRDPEARQLLEEYRHIDQAARQAMAEMLGQGEPGFDPVRCTNRSLVSPARVYLRSWWLWSGAVAAAVLAFSVARLQPTPSGGPQPPWIVDRGRADTHAMEGLASTPQEGLFRTVGAGRPAVPNIRRDTGREVFGVIGEDGNVYWIEVDRTRTIKRPGIGRGSLSPV